MTLGTTLAVAAALAATACEHDVAQPDGMDEAAFVEALRADGAKVTEGATVSQPFLAVRGRELRLDAEPVQAFEYPTSEAAAADAARVAPNGGSVGGTMISWIGPPHFHLRDRLLVIYVGSDARTRARLERTLGPQFAGQD